jgi:vancomycin aglycone glucosyltransferase
VTEVAAGQFKAVAAAAEGCGAVVATGLFPSTAASRSIAEALGVPYVKVAYCPVFLPSPHHPPLPFPGRPLPHGVR